MTDIQYLTVQDVIWLNTRITGETNDFQFMKLEEGTFYQYAYGSAQGVVPQAARFVVGLLKNQPFSRGNEATALAAVLLFLRANGYTFETVDVASLRSKVGSVEAAQSAIESFAKEGDGHGHASIAESGEEILRTHGAQLAALEGAPA